HDQQVEVSVQPTFLSNKHPLAAVKNEYNAVYVKAESVGETMFYGAGAGGLPTATAIMSDVVETIKNTLIGVNGKQLIKQSFTKELTSPENKVSQFYLPLHAKDEMGAFASISELFKEKGNSFDRILQTPSNTENLAEIVVVTYETTLLIFNEA